MPAPTSLPTVAEQRAWVVAWFTTGDSGALDQLFSFLSRRLRAPHAVRDLLGTLEVEDVQADTLIALLDRERASGTLRDADNPLVFALGAYRFRLASAVRKRARRDGLTARYASDEAVSTPQQVHLDFHVGSAPAAWDELGARQRLALLLPLLPDCIAAEDWAAVSLVGAPPPNALPLEAVADLLDPPTPDEEADARRRRLGRFYRMRSRALAKLRAALDSEGAE